MGIKEWLGFGKQPTVVVEPPKKTAKEIATARGEPYVAVIGFDVDPDNVSNGSFELDFNEIFVARLLKAGYRGKNDYEIVDQWFNTICRNVALETFEQELADPEKRAEWNAMINQINN